MTRRAGLLVILALAGCSGLDTTDAGIVGLEISYARPDTVEVGETIQLTARPLDKNGDSVAAAVTWASPDTTVSLDATTGLLTGVAPGTARVQAAVGSLSSPLITFGVIAPADTLIILGDSVLTVPTGAGQSDSMAVELASLHPAGPVVGRKVIYAITVPDPTAGVPVTFIGGAVVDTFTTGSDGIVTNARLVPVAGAVLPDSVVVEVRAIRTRGATVPGSGQHFFVRFQP